MIKVCYELNSDSQKREIGGLTDAMHHFNLNRGTIISMHQEDVILHEGKRIEVIPAYKFFS